MDTKAWYLSKTLWVAIIQAVLAIATALTTANPNIAHLSWFAVGESALIAGLRLITWQGIN